MIRSLIIVACMISSNIVFGQEFIHYDSVQCIMNKKLEVVGSNLINADGSPMGPFVVNGEEQQASDFEVRQQVRMKDKNLRKEEE